MTEYDWVGLNYRAEQVKVQDVEPSEETEFLKNETRTTSRLAPSYIRDTRDDFLNPSTGWRHVVRFEVAGGILGGADFLRSGYEVTYYFPIIGKLVGALHSENQLGRRLQRRGTPPFSRGISWAAPRVCAVSAFATWDRKTVREILWVEPSRCSSMRSCNTRSPNRSVGFVFYDRGNVYGTGTDISSTAKTISLSDMRHSVGAGIRFLSPFGPVGFAYGIKLDQRDGEDLGEFHFTAGSSF